MNPTKPHTAAVFLIAAFVALAAPARAADPAVKALKKASRAVEKTVRQEGATQFKALRDSLGSLLQDVKAETTTPSAALAQAVLEATEAAGAVSTAAFDGAIMVREDAVNDALGGTEGSVLLGTDFQAGAGGGWDKFITKLHTLMSKLDVRIEKELWRFVGKLEKTVAKLGDSVDMHLQVRGHDRRIDAIQCPASLAANPGGEALEDVPVMQVFIEARFVELGSDFSSQLGVFGFGNSSVDLSYETTAGSELVSGVPMLPSGVALNTRSLGNPSIGPYRIDILDPATGERADSVGGRPPSTSSASGVQGIVKQARQLMNQDFKFFGKVTGEIRSDYRKADAAVCKDLKQGRIDVGSALDELFANQRAALGGTNFWEGIVLRNPAGFAEGELLSAGVADEDIPDDLAADAGGAFSKHLERVERRSAQRLSSFQRISDRSVARIIKKLAKDDVSVAAVTRSPRIQSVQGPTITTLPNPVLQLEVRPQITSASIITLELAPSIVESNAYLTGRTPDIDTSLVLTNVNLADGNTVVLGGLTSSPGDNTFQEKVPLLGNVPLIGRLFRAKSMDQADTDLVVLVTPMFLKDQ